jgi:hypothetical protein
MAKERGEFWNEKMETLSPNAPKHPPTESQFFDIRCLLRSNECGKEDVHINLE